MDICIGKEGRVLIKNAFFMNATFARRGNSCQYTKFNIWNQVIFKNDESENIGVSLMPRTDFN